MKIKELLCRDLISSTMVKRRALGVCQDIQSHFQHEHIQLQMKSKNGRLTVEATFSMGSHINYKM